MTEPDLQTLCAEWQARLGLAHWNITVGFARAKDMPVMGCDACMKPNYHSEFARIFIVDPIDYSSDTGEEQDIEECLIHEILHIPMSYICEPDDNKLLETHVEAHIDRLAKVLVALKREARARPSKEDICASLAKVTA
jgi:hypothetical protein